MKFTIQQAILVTLSLFFIFDRLTKFLRGERTQSIFKLLSTVILWSIILTITLSPSFTKLLMKKLGVGDNILTLIFAGFVIVFAVVFKFLGIIEKLERNITELVRREALKDLNK